MKSSKNWSSPPMNGAGTFKQHYYFLKQAIDRAGVSATLDLTTSIIKLQYPKKAILLLPQFSKVNESGRVYNAIFENPTDRFAGWRPYSPIFLESFKDKLTLKKRLADKGCLVPEATEDQRDALKKVIIKRRHSSFSEHIQGPFHSSLEQPLKLKAGEFYESFVKGTITKVWFRNESPLCMELAPMPQVVGDGSHSIRELIARKLQSKHTNNPFLNTLLHLIQQKNNYITDKTHFVNAEKTLVNIVQVLNFYKKSLDDIPQKDEYILLDFRYIHAFDRQNSTYWIDHCEYDLNDYKEQLHKIGSMVNSLITEEQCKVLFYTIDGIIDENNNIWVLEVNSNPMIHPFAYDDMVTYLSH